MRSKLLKCSAILTLTLVVFPTVGYADTESSIDNDKELRTAKKNNATEEESSVGLPNNQNEEKSYDINANPISQDEDINVWMPDTGLQKAVSTALRISIDNLKKTDLEKMIGLDSYGNAISNLKGLEYAKNLRILNLNKQTYIEDISGLKDLTQLQLFNLEGVTNVFDLTPLTNLKELSSLTILSQATQPESWNTVAIENLNKLNTLKLDNIFISNENFFSNLTNLNTLSIQHSNQPKLISMVKEISSLRKINFVGNLIEDLNGIGNLTNLQELDLSFNYIRDIRPLQNVSLPNIQSINLSNQRIGLLKYQEISWTAKEFFDNNVITANEIIPLTPLKGQYTGVYDEEKNGVTWSGLGNEFFGEYYTTFNRLIKYQSIDVPYTGGVNGFFVRVKEINFNYFDQENNLIQSTTERYKLADHGFSPNYDYSDGSYQKNIDGYYLNEDKLPQNLKGSVTDTVDDGIDINYYYKKIQVKVNYVDESGNKLSNTNIIEGTKLGETYQSSPIHIEGYTLKEVQGNEKGEFLPEEQILTYVYKKTSENSKGKVTVNYHDENGKELATSEILTGKIGETYKIKELSIDGYTLKEVKGDLTNIFSKEDQNVIFIYEKDPKIGSTQISNISGRSQKGSIHPISSTISGNTKEKLPTTGEKVGSVLPYAGSLIVFIASFWIFRKRKRD